MPRLQPENREQDDLLSAETSFDEFTRTRSAWLYLLRNTDLMAVYENAETKGIEEAIVKLLKLWSGDALMKRFKTDPRKKQVGQLV